LGKEPELTVELELTIETKSSGAVAVQRLPFGGRIVLGRGPESPVALDGPQISREHIAFEGDDGQLCVTDLSANGSWVNGEQLTNGRRYLVTEADRVQVPGYEIHCILLSGAEPKPATANAPATPPLNPVKGFMSTLTATEIMVLMLVGTAIVIAVVYSRL
jgi:predicted component of type VI protein secretion system